MTVTPNKSRTFRVLPKPLWWVAFLAATYLMSLWFQTFKVFTLTPNLMNGLSWLAVMGVLLLVIAVMTYDSYVQERLKGRIQKPARLFEWLIQKRFLLPPSFEMIQQKDATP